MNKGVLTDKSYWGAIWRDQKTLPPAFDPADKTLYNTVNLRLHEVFEDYIAGLPQTALVMELGCAQSEFLPYFARHFGVRVAGLDYEEEGCARARAMLARDGVEGEIICADLFNPPPSWHETADVLFTYGLVEHFVDTAAVLRACAVMLKPGGVMITVIPNMAGAVGLAQKLADPAIYALHVPLTEPQLQAAHVAAGMDVLRSEYFMGINNNVLHVPRIKNRFWHQVFRRFLSLTTKPVWLIERTGLRLPPSRFLSPYILVVARKVAL